MPRCMCVQQKAHKAVFMLSGRKPLVYYKVTQTRRSQHSLVAVWVVSEACAWETGFCSSQFFFFFQ